MEIYEDKPVGDFRRAIALHGEKILIGDPVKMAQAMIASSELKPAPQRLVLGSDAYQHIEASLVERLALLRSQKELAFSTDLLARPRSVERESLSVPAFIGAPRRNRTFPRCVMSFTTGPATRAAAIGRA